MMTEGEELRLQDALTSQGFLLTGVPQAPWPVRSDSSEYPMFQVLSDAMLRSINAIKEAMPEEWRKEIELR